MSSLYRVFFPSSTFFIPTKINHESRAKKRTPVIPRFPQVISFQLPTSHNFPPRFSAKTYMWRMSPTIHQKRKPTGIPAKTKSRFLAMEKENGSDLRATAGNIAREIRAKIVKRTPYKWTAILVSLVWRRPESFGPGMRVVKNHSGVANAE